MLVLNAYILNKKFGERKLSHSDYREYIAEYLIHQSNRTDACVDTDNFLQCDRPVGRHWPMKFERNAMGRIVPHQCKVCCVGLKEKNANRKREKEEKYIL